MSVFKHGALRLYLLRLLETAPRHGYELMQSLEQRFGGTYSPSAGTIYPRLAKLEEEGLVTKTVDGRTATYAITNAGREHVHARRAELDELERDIQDSVRRLADEVRAGVRDAMRTLRADLAAAKGQAWMPDASAASSAEDAAPARAAGVDQRSAAVLRDAVQADATSTVGKPTDATQANAMLTSAAQTRMSSRVEPASYDDPPANAGPRSTPVPLASAESASPEARAGAIPTSAAPSDEARTCATPSSAARAGATPTSARPTSATPARTSSQAAPSSHDDPHTDAGPRSTPGPLASAESASPAAPKDAVPPSPASTSQAPTRPAAPSDSQGTVAPSMPAEQHLPAEQHSTAASQTAASQGNAGRQGTPESATHTEPQAANAAPSDTLPPAAAAEPHAAPGHRADTASDPAHHRLVAHDVDLALAALRAEVRAAVRERDRTADDARRIRDELRETAARIRAILGE